MFLRLFFRFACRGSDRLWANFVERWSPPGGHHFFHSSFWWPNIFVEARGGLTAMARSWLLLLCRCLSMIDCNPLAVCRELLGLESRAVDSVEEGAKLAALAHFGSTSMDYE